MSRCFEPHEIAAVLELPDGHPGRRHLDRCPRCRSLALAYYEHAERADREGDETPGADADLQRRLAHAFAGRPAPSLSRWRLDWPWPVWATLLVSVAAALLLVCGELGTPRPGAGDGHGLDATLGPDGLTVRWDADPDTPRAVVVFYDAERRRLGERTTTASWLTVPPGDPLAEAASCQLLRVAAGDTVGRSAAVAVQRAAE